MAFLQNFDTVHIYGKGPTLKYEIASCKEDGRVLNICIGQAANTAKTAHVIATNHSEEWLSIEKCKIDQCSWIITPRHPLINSNPQDIIEWSDIGAIKSKKNVTCCDVEYPGESSVVSCLRHVLKNSCFVSKIRFCGVAHRSGKAFPFFRIKDKYNEREEIKSLRSQLNRVLHSSNIAVEYL